MTEEYIAQVSEEIEGRVTIKLSQKISWTKSCILGAPSKNDEFLQNPRVRTGPGTVRETPRNIDLENRKLTGDRSQNEPYPEVHPSIRQASDSVYSDQQEASHRSGWIKKVYKNWLEISDELRWQIWGSDGQRSKWSRKCGTLVKMNAIVLTILLRDFSNETTLLVNICWASISLIIFIEKNTIKKTLLIPSSYCGEKNWYNFLVGGVMKIFQLSNL